LYDYRRCPKIVSIKAYRTIRTVREKHVSQPRELEPAIIGKIGERAVELGFAGLPQSAAMRQITRAIPQVNLSENLMRIALDSLRGVERILVRLRSEFGEIRVIGKGEGRHPDLAGIVRPDFIAFSENKRDPIIVETKDTTRKAPTDRFQAMFYNGVADRFGVYLLEQRLERGDLTVSPRVMRSGAKSILIYPRLAQYSTVEEKFVPDEVLIKGVWKAKELGFMGRSPETECRATCAHHRLKVDLPESDMEPLPPPPLIFSEGILQGGGDLDTDYQVSYAWKLLPTKVKLALLISNQERLAGLMDLKSWLMRVMGIDESSADIILDPEKQDKFARSRPSADMLLRSMGNELEAWRGILKKRLEIAGPSILARATSVYSLPRRSEGFVKDAWKRWQ
jgi:hypothetical protein